MTLEPLGDCGLILRDLPVAAWQWADFLNASEIEGLIEAYASYDTVGLEIDPMIFDQSALPSPKGELPEAQHRILDIPVCYELGADLLGLCATLGLSPDAFIQLHSSALYRCEAIGFCPGFPYLSGLHTRLCGIPRMSSPRTRTEVGAVAITGSQCGIYPLPRPGGWQVLGRTPLQLVDVEDGYFPIHAGDQIRFFAISLSQYEIAKGNRL